MAVAAGNQSWRPEPGCWSIDIIHVRRHTGILRATLLTRTRIVYADNVFAEIVVWEVPQALSGSMHTYKYRLALVADGICVLRYDNEPLDLTVKSCRLYPIT